MGRYAILEDRYERASRMLAEAREILAPVHDPELPDARLASARKSIDDALDKLRLVYVDCGRLAVQTAG